MGKLIVIEGLDGAGKSTQWEMLKSKLDNITFITFPDYESESGKIVSRYLAGEFGDINSESDSDGFISAYSASSFYAVDRYISCKTSWGGLYNQGAVLISARYTSSNVIYQMTKLPESKWEEYLDWLYDYEFVKLGIPKPDLTILLDVPVEISQKLLAKRYTKQGGHIKDIHEGDIGYLKRCRKAAEYAAKRDNWLIIDCVNNDRLRTADDINRELTRIIEDVINDRNYRI